MTHVEAFILIGGRSSRLGTDKAFVELGGQTLASRAAQTTQQGLAPERVTMVAGNSLQFAIKAVVDDIPFIFDLREGRGPLGGLHAALAYARTPWIFVLACDYPFVSVEHLQLLAGKLADDRGAVVPQQSDGRMQPLCAFYSVKRVLPVVEEILDRPRLPPPMHEIVTTLHPRIVGFDEYSSLDGAEDLFMNINTVEDLDRARLRAENAGL